MRWMKITFGVVLLALPIFSQAPNDTTTQRAHRKPWQWTDEERITARIAHARSRGLSANGTAGGAAYEIRGRANPELFMPHELFDGLLIGVDTGSASNNTRFNLDSGLKLLGFSDTEKFWQQLATIAENYLKLKKDFFNPANMQTAEQRVKICRERIAALNRARQEFGEERFNKVLYVLVAPGTDWNYSSTSSDIASRLRNEASGCQ